MAKTNFLEWDNTSERYYETGVNHAVLYPYENTYVDGEKTHYYAKGVVWNGITAINESPSGAEENKLFADNIKYLSMRSAEEFGATVEAYTYPDEFAECDGSAYLGGLEGVTIGQQTRKTFGLSYRTIFGNDTEGDGYGEILHLVYGASASPSERSRSTVNDSPEATTFSWEIATTPVEVGTVNGVQYKPTSHLQINLRKFKDAAEGNAAKITALETIMYGAANAENNNAVYLPLPSEVYTILGAAG